MESTGKSWIATGMMMILFRLVTRGRTRSFVALPRMDDFPMAEEAKLSFYTVEKCGYYDDEQDAPQFCALGHLLPDLKEWVTRENKPIKRTRTFEPQGDSDVQPVYCAGVHRHDGHQDYVLTTWNETPSIDGQTASIEGDTSVANPTVRMMDVPEGAIPGFATYFWFIPEHNLVATVRFQHLANGQKGLCLYLRSYLQKFSSHVVTQEPEDDEADLDILGYRRDAHSGIQNLRPLFRTAAKRRAGPIERIRAGRAMIRRVIHKNRLRLNAQGDLALWQRMLIRMGIQHPPQYGHEIKCRNIVDFTPTEAQLNAIIAAWEADHDLKWDDVGFELSGEPQPLWLSHAFAKTALQLDIDRHNPELVDGQSLLTELAAHRDQILEAVLHDMVAA